jgi:hypothetical protein
MHGLMIGWYLPGETQIHRNSSTDDSYTASPRSNSVEGVDFDTPSRRMHAAELESAVSGKALFRTSGLNAMEMARILLAMSFNHARVQLKTI